jgi:DNA-binding transcriptional ArsR family regulator
MATRRTGKPKTDEPLAELKISDLETIRIMSDPLRLRIIQAMSADIDEPWTVKRLAAALGVPATKLYYHVNLLEKHGLVRVTGTGIVSGIVESRYAITARRFGVARSVFGSDAEDGGNAMAGLLTSMLDTTRDEILANVANGTIVSSEGDPDSPLRLTVGKSIARLSLARAVEFRQQVDALLKAFEEDHEPDGVTLSALVAIYPIES